MAERDTVMSEELLAELEEGFSSLSNTKDSKGYVWGRNMEKLCESFGLFLPAVLQTFYAENGTDKVFIDTFYKTARSCFANKHTCMDAEIKEVFSNFCGQDNGSAEELDSFDMTSWLQKLGEHCDASDVQRQLGSFCPGEDDPGKSMHMDTFLTMVKKQGVVVLPIE